MTSFSYLVVLAGVVLPVRRLSGRGARRVGGRRGRSGRGERGTASAAAAAANDGAPNAPRARRISHAADDVAGRVHDGRAAAAAAAPWNDGAFCVPSAGDGEARWSGGAGHGSTQGGGRGAEDPGSDDGVGGGGGGGDGLQVLPQRSLHPRLTVPLLARAYGTGDAAPTSRP